MRTRLAANKYMKERRAKLSAEGICVDCQKNEVQPDPANPKQKHVCCADCRKARRDRVSASKRQASLPFYSTEATL